VDYQFQPKHAIVLSVRISWTDIGGRPDSGSDTPFDEVLSAKIAALVSSCGGSVVAKSENDFICVVDSLENAIEAVGVIGRQCCIKDIGRHVALRMGIYVNDSLPRSETEWAYCVASARQLGRIASSGQTLVCMYGKLVPERLERVLTPIDSAEWADGAAFSGARLFSVSWQDGVETSLVQFPARDCPVTRVTTLRLRWRNQQLVLGADSPEVTLGRGADIDIAVDSEFASRRHAYIRYENACFILADTSTNGTFVNLDDSVVFIHDDEIILRGQGWVSLGKRAPKSLGKVVYFSTEVGTPHSDGKYIGI